MRPRRGTATPVMFTEILRGRGGPYSAPPTFPDQVAAVLPLTTTQKFGARDEPRLRDVVEVERQRDARRSNGGRSSSPTKTVYADVPTAKQCPGDGHDGWTQLPVDPNGPSRCAVHTDGRPSSLRLPALTTVEQGRAPQRWRRPRPTLLTDAVSPRPISRLNHTFLRRFPALPP